MNIETLPTYDEFLGQEAALIDAAVFSSCRRRITAAEVRHNAWRRLRENWSLANIILAIHGKPTVDLVQHTPDWPGTPSYAELVNIEGPQVDAAYLQAHQVKPAPSDIRHNAWRRLVEGWTQDNVLKSILGEPNDGPTLPKPGDAIPGVLMATRRAGIVRAAGQAIEDDGGPFLAVGFSLFAALWAFRHDRDRLKDNLAKLAGRVHYVRVLAAVGPSGGWEDRTVDPKAPGFQEDAAGLMDLLFDTYGIRILWTVFGGIDLVPTKANRRQVVTDLIAAAQGRFDKIIHWEVANEAWQNGFSGADGRDEMRVLAGLLRAKTPNLVALSAPKDDAQATDWYQGSQANLATIHPDRSTNGTGGLWRPVRQPWEVHFLDGIPAVRSLNEPIGPQSSVAQDAHPVRLTMLAMVGYLTGSALFVLHTGPGVRFGGAADQARGRVANVWEVENIDAILDGLNTVAGQLPGDVPNWSKQNGNRKFPDYPFGVDGLTEDRILRAYAAVGGSRFLVAPIQVMKDTDFPARRPMRVIVRNPLTWEAISSHTLGHGEVLTLAGDQDSPRAYVLDGEYSEGGTV